MEITRLVFFIHPCLLGINCDINYMSVLSNEIFKFYEVTYNMATSSLN